MMAMDIPVIDPGRRAPPLMPSRSGSGPGATDALPERDVALFRTAAPRGSGALHARKSTARIGRSRNTTTSWRSNYEPQGVLLRLHARRHHHCRGGTANIDPLPMFIAMDPPKHDVQRKAVSPAAAPPGNPRSRADDPRARRRRFCDDLPIGEEFDWVDKVSIELTAMTSRRSSTFPAGGSPQV